MTHKMRRKDKEACRRKRHFQSEAGAWAAARGSFKSKSGMFVRQSVQAAPQFIRPYKCPVCKGWHIGTRSRKVQAWDMRR